MDAFVQSGSRVPMTWISSLTSLLAGCRDILRRLATWFATPGRPRGSAYLDLQADDEDAMASIVGASISYRLAFGSNAGLGVPEVTLSHSRRCPPETLKINGRWQVNSLASLCMPGWPVKQANTRSWNVRAALRSAGILPARRSLSNDSRLPVTDRSSIS